MKNLLTEIFLRNLIFDSIYRLCFFINSAIFDSTFTSILSPRSQISHNYNHGN